MKTIWIILIGCLLLAGCRSSTPPPPAIPLPEAEGWQLIFRDEFDRAKLDTDKWNTCYPWEEDGGCTNAGNAEKQWYQADDVLLEKGLLRLRAQVRQRGSFPYTSGMIASHGKFSFQYGYVEARLKVPAGKGLWPALWLLPASGEWPPEIDILEVLGHQPQTVYTTLHYKKPGQPHLSLGSQFSGPDYSADFHTFGLLWEGGSLTWYIDGEAKYTLEQNVPSEPMYLIANLAVGGNWPGYPDETTPFPSYYEIDYIRVYQNPSRAATQKAPTLTPSGGSHILHAAVIQAVDSNGNVQTEFPAGGVDFRVQVVNQDGMPIQGAEVRAALLDASGKRIKGIASLAPTSRQGWAVFFATFDQAGEYRLKVEKINLPDDPQAGYDPQADATPFAFQIK